MMELSPEIRAEMARRRARAGRGCFGCLWQLPLLLGLGCVLVIAITGVFAPWGFYFGGKFHIIPYWQGWGEMHAKSGRYVLYVRFEPSSHGSRILPGAYLNGVARLCTPRHERFYMHLGGGMPRNPDLRNDGVPISLYMDNWSSWLANLNADHRPSIKFRGHWQNPNIVMDDEGSISNEFNDDGTVYRVPVRNRPYSTQIVPITLMPGSYSDFDRACNAR
jgi:hypothetical protein